jgi:DNA-binding response OmpR family regulator
MGAQKSAKIMLVEDDATMRSVLRTLLEIEGFQVVTMPDLKTEEEMVSAIKAEMPDIALMDVHIHKVNGIKVLRQLRDDPAMQNMRVYMCSGMDKKEECMNGGANGFLMKPYMPDELIDMIRS